MEEYYNANYVTYRGRGSRESTGDFYAIKNWDCPARTIQPLNHVASHVIASKNPLDLLGEE